MAIVNGVELCGDHDSWKSFFLLECIKQEVFDQEGFDPEHIDVKFVINGVECPLDRAIDAMGEAFDGIVKEKATELVMKNSDIISKLVSAKERGLRQVSNKLHDLQEHVDDLFDDVKQKVDRLWDAL